MSKSIDTKTEASERALDLGLVSPAGSAATAPKQAAERVPSLEGRTVGLLHNRKVNGDLLLSDLGELLRERYGVGDAFLIQKFHYSRRATPELLDEIAEKSDFVVTAIGDCGSCTSGSLHDAVQIEARGVPAVAVCTDVFMSSAEAHALAFGRPDLETVSIEHPLVGLPPEQVRERAETAVDRIAAVISGASRN